MAFGCILLSITFAPNFSWTDSALSDLGVMPNPTAILFNSGLIISGILAMVFASGLFSILKGKSTGRAGTLLFLLDCLALTAIGVFPENTRPMHFYASVAFFALFPLSMLLITAYFVLASRNRMAVFTFLVSVFAAAVWIIWNGRSLLVKDGDTGRLFRMVNAYMFVMVLGIVLNGIFLSPISSRF